MHNGENMVQQRCNQVRECKSDCIKLFQLDSLVLIASQALRNENLQILLATLIQRENTCKWKENATCNLFAPIPSENDL